MTVEELRNNPILKNVQSMKIGMIYLNYFIQTPETNALELDLLVEGITRDDSNYVIIFEFKNRDEKKPTQNEVQDFIQKIEMLKYSLNRQGKQNTKICSIYFSANGFDKTIENGLHDNNILTADMNSWEIV